MINDGIYLGDQSGKIRRDLVIDLPRWLEKAVELKNPRVTLALAYSILLTYDDIDQKLLLFTTLN